MRLAGLEPARVAPLPPQGSASANSAITAWPQGDHYSSNPEAMAQAETAGKWSLYQLPKVVKLLFLLRSIPVVIQLR